LSNSHDNGLIFPTRDAVRPDRPCPELPSGWLNPVRAFAQQARETPSDVLIEDSLGQTATYGEAYISALALALHLKKLLKHQAYTGILLPPSRGGLIANIAVSMLGQVPINLNYSGGDAPINSAIDQTGLSVVLSTKKVVEKGGFKFNAQILYLEDIVPQISGWTKAGAWYLANLAPIDGIGVFLPGFDAKLEDTATIMFTSGSSGEPKGVELTNANVLYNTMQQSAHARVGREVILGSLPYFHSYGYGVTLWASMLLHFKIIAHHNPLDARGICETIEKHGVTMFATTPTFARNYLKRGSREQFKTVRMLMLGSEKLKPELARDIRQKLDIVPCEGYGTTELSPVVSGCVNFEVASPKGGFVSGNREGSVGQVVPGTTIAIIDSVTGQALPRGRANEGRIFVHGPQVMKGYYRKPGETGAVLRNGWYFTGDIGALDEDGFLYLTDRESRFAKVGPEMVPLVKVEAALRQLANVDELSIALCAVPDPTKGEKVVALYSADGINPSELTRALAATGMHALWIPKANDFHKVPGPFPQTASGKLDLKAIRKTALQLDGQG